MKGNVFEIQEAQAENIGREYSRFRRERVPDRGGILVECGTVDRMRSIEPVVGLGKIDGVEGGDGRSVRGAGSSQ